LVEREYEGEYCEFGVCPGVDYGQCTRFGNVELWLAMGSLYRRCPQCLATPAAVVLTSEGAAYLREMDDYFEREGTKGFRNGLRLHFPTIFMGSQP